ncbi:MAG: MBL fold metallo-hydrolase [Candidatus Sericytochromatia bacterium]|nr:MBL fold metallo-hydrolase [Candidatus Sericytochromatia bacterium]
MRVRFWGTRGSIAKPGPRTVRYGGNTSCVEVRGDDGTLLVLDCGTGAHELGFHLMAHEPKPIRGHMLIGHTHWDHIQGMPFFTPLFVPGNEWDVYAPHGLVQELRDTLAAQMDYTFFPVALHQLGATIRYHDLLEGHFSLGGVEVRTQYLNHPALTLGYRLEADGCSVVYSTDHEPHSRQLALGEECLHGRADRLVNPEERRHLDFIAGADLLIHDTQYTAAEYPARLGWGHSTLEYVVEMALAAKVKRLALFHHDPMRDDAAVDELVQRARQHAEREGSSIEIFAAAEGQVLELSTGASPGTVRDTGPLREARRKLPAVPRGTAQAPCVVLGLPEGPVRSLLVGALEDEGLRVVLADGDDALLDAVQVQVPSLIILRAGDPASDPLAFSRRLRADARAISVIPVFVVAESEDPELIAAGAEAGISDWLLLPFSGPYARTKVRAWLLRDRDDWDARPTSGDVSGVRSS